MQIELTPNHVHIIITEAATAATRLQRKLGLPTCDRDDLAQDLLVDLLRRLHAYDPQRGTLGAFAGLILRNQSARIAMREMRERRERGGTAISLDAPSGRNDPRPLSERIAEDAGLSAFHGQTVTALATAETRHALRSAFGRLPDADRRFCAALSEHSVPALATRGFGTRSVLYRRLAELRHVLTAHGLGSGWDDPAAA